MTGNVSREVDVLIISAGVAGLASTRRELVLSKGDGSTRWAQGGIGGRRRFPATIRAGMPRTPQSRAQA